MGSPDPAVVGSQLPSQLNNKGIDVIHFPNWILANNEKQRHDDHEVLTPGRLLSQLDLSGGRALLPARVSALGERLWSDPGAGLTWKQAETRMIHHRQVLVSRGIEADALQPEWCHQNEALCYVRNT